MVIAGRKGFEIIMCLHSGRVLRLCITHRSSIFRNLPIHNIIPDISTEEKALVRNDCICRKRGTLEQVKEGTSMQSLVSIVDANFGVLGCCAGEEGRSELEFDALCDLIVEFDFCVEGVCGGPALGQGDSTVGVLAFELPRDSACDKKRVWLGSTNFGVLVAFDGELDSIGRFGFYF